MNEEFWKPPITPEEDAQTSRTFTIARRNSTASTTSSFKAPSIVSVAFTEPLDALSSNDGRERRSIHSTDQEWTSLDRARERDRERERSGYVYADDRSVHSGNQRLEDCLGFSLFSATSPGSATYPQPGDSSRVHVPPPSASRPIVNKRSFTTEDAFPPQPGPSSRNWNMVSRYPYETRWEGSSRSSQSPEEVGQSWQSPQFQGRFSSQDMRLHYFQQEGGYYGSRRVHPHREDFEEDGSDDGFDNRSWRTRDHNERRIQDIEEELRKREEAANRREEELARKAEELKREAELRKKKVEELRCKEETRRPEEEIRQKEDDEAGRKAELQRNEEEANRKEREAAMKEEEARKKEQEAKKKEREALLKEEEAKRREKEIKCKELEARRREEELKRKEQEVKSREMMARRKEEEARRKEEEARRKEEEARRKEEEVKMMEEDARRKEYDVKRKQEEAVRKEEEARRKTEETILEAEETQKKEKELHKREEELRRKEEDLNRREAEMRRREDDKLQEEFRRREDEIRRQRAEDRKKQKVWETWPPETFRPTPSSQTPNSSGNWPVPNHNERSTPKLQEEFRRREDEIRRQRAEDRKKQKVWETWPPETFRPTPSPQTPNSSGTWPVPNHNERSTPTAASPPTDRVSTSASGRGNPINDWSSTFTRPTFSTNTQSSSTPKPTGSATPTPKPSTSSTPNPSLTEAEFHRRQAEQAQQREEQFRREQARLAMQEHERQGKAGKTMSKEEVTRLFEAHRNQWDKIQTLGSLIWEDLPWPMFKRPKGPDGLASHAITAYMLSPIHPQDRATKKRIKDNIRRWHHDRFNSQLLPKVKESERERISEGAASVARVLYHLLRTHEQDNF